METLKKWGLALLGVLLIVLDQGFEVVNPFLVGLGVPEKWIGIIKVLSGAYALYKTTIQESPKSRFIGGSNPPPSKDEK
jgi:hypothetical protein